MAVTIFVHIVRYLLLGEKVDQEKENILKEIEKLVEDGFKEVILIGIDLSAYGEDFKEKDNFESLLEEILKIKI